MGHLHNGILLGHKKRENLTLCNSMEGPGEHCISEISQSEKKTGTIGFHSHVESNEQSGLTSKERLTLRWRTNDS